LTGGLDLSAERYAAPSPQEFRPQSGGRDGGELQQGLIQGVPQWPLQWKGRSPGQSERPHCGC